MLFTSREFVVFFIVVAFVYFTLPYRFRWVVLLIASYLFYAIGETGYVALLVLTTVVSYCAALTLERAAHPGQRRVTLAAGLAILFTPLLLFKYADFFLGSASGIDAAAGQQWHTGHLGLLLPLGISFFTFQAAGYVIDVYCRRVPAERHPGVLALYISLFPQLIAGPIERAERLLPQLTRSAAPDPQRTVEGLRLILWGAFKKVVIADNLGVYVDHVYADPTAYNGLPLIVATLLFAFQIYCDFSGYVDIARGTARILGIELMHNFDRPYGATSIGNFWHRWHISLSSWFRDYLYIPLGGSRRGSAVQLRNLMIVFLVSGLWHGANWTFVVWGGLHGSFLVVSVLTLRWRTALAEASGLARHQLLHRAVQVGTTFALVCFAWIFFRAETLADAFYVATHLFATVPDHGSGLEQVSRAIAESGGTAARLWLAGGLAAALFIGHQLPRDAMRILLRRGFASLRWSGYYAAVASILFFAAVDVPFIYFRF